MEDPDTPRLRRLFLFDAVSRAGGIGPAASAFGLSQPAVSLAISKLEASFSTLLFERGYGGTELTAQGEVLQRRVKRLLNQIEQAVSALFGVHLPNPQAIARACRHLTDSQVRCHIAIAQCGSAAEAARQLSISQPAVHRAARDLERSLGITLYRRRVHSVAANPLGVEFARRLSVALNEIKQAGVDLAAARGELRGRVTIGILPLAPQHLMAAAAETLLKRYPRATVGFIEGAHEQLIDDLRFGSLDMVVGALRDSPELPGAVASRLFVDPHRVAVRADHPLAGRPQVSLEDLAGFQWMAPPTDMPRRAVVDAMLAQLPKTAQAPPLVIETSSLSMMMAMLAESDCITLLPESQIRAGRPGSSGNVVALPVDTPESGRAVGLTTRVDWLATRVQQAYVAELRRLCDERPLAAA
jgi:LysR family transcriptional regulator of gallate degradation